MKQPGSVDRFHPFVARVCRALSVFNGFPATVRRWLNRSPNDSRTRAPRISDRITFQINREVEITTAQGQVKSSRPESTSGLSSASRGNRPELVRAVAEIFLILLFFGLFAGQLPPDVNESHYLTKSKHFWDPEWCPGDLFLGSAFSHWFFYFSTGWLTKFMSLDAYAWTGRLLTWALLATAWYRLSWRLIPRYGFSFLSAALFVLLNDRFHLAGEWIVGGFESKGIAYALVLFAIEQMIRRNWHFVWPLAGLASAFHVLVGGWSIGVFLFCGILVRVLSAKSRGTIAAGITAIPAWKSTAGVLAGVVFFLVGASPPLLTDLQTPPDVALEASHFYVHSRISHHLLFGNFPSIFVARFVMMTIAWGLFATLLVRFRPLWKLQLFCAGSLLISLGGLLLSGLAEEGGTAADISDQLLRFYWFRLADFAVPAALSLSVTVVLAHWIYSPGSGRLQKTGTLAVAILVLASTGLMIVERNIDPRPRADQRSLPTYPDEPQRTADTFRNWQRVCEWIRLNTEQDAVFITPSQQQTFKWYAGRTEVACWKDIPQDAESILSWSDRLNDVFYPQQEFVAGLMSYSDSQLIELAEKYQADYLLVPQYQVEQAMPLTEFEQVYPEGKSKSTYVVLKFEQGR